MAISSKACSSTACPAPDHVPEKEAKGEEQESRRRAPEATSCSADDRNASHFLFAAVASRAQVKGIDATAITQV